MVQALRVIFVAISLLQIVTTRAGVVGQPCPTPQPAYSGYSVTHCPKGWVRYGQEKCFKLFDGKVMTPEDAKAFCRALDADLPSIHSDDEHEFLKSVIQMDHELHGTAGGVIIGGFLRGTRWLWSDHSRFDYTNWWPTNPVVNQSCTALTTHRDYINSKNFGKIATFSCSVNGYVVCQKYQAVTFLTK